MNIIYVQIILLFFAFFMVYVLFLHWKKKEITNLTFFFWLMVWGAFICFTLFPKILEPLLKELFIVRAMDLGMIGAFMILTYITIENNIKMKKYEDQLENLVRKIATIKKNKNKKRNKNKN